MVCVQVEIRDLEALKRACERLKWQFHEGQTRYCWYGLWVDDSPAPRNLFASEEEYKGVLAMRRVERCQHMTDLLNHCQHAIHIPGYEYEIGVFKVGDSYQLSYDWVGDIACVLGSPENPAIVNPLLQAYAIELERLKAKQLGYGIEETLNVDGSVRLTLTNYGG